MKKFNAMVAELVMNITGNMWFFWLALGFVLWLRLSHIPPVAEILLDVENDLQLLLLATAAVVGSKSQKHLENMLRRVQRLEEELLAKSKCAGTCKCVKVREKAK